MRVSCGYVTPWVGGGYQTIALCVCVLCGGRGRKRFIPVPLVPRRSHFQISLPYTTLAPRRVGHLALTTLHETCERHSSYFDLTLLIFILFLSLILIITEHLFTNCVDFGFKYFTNQHFKIIICIQPNDIIYNFVLLFEKVL